MTPVVEIGRSYCLETCNRCLEVCPTGAIAHKSLEEKQNISIGVAEVLKSRCVSWKHREYCMICASYCPYGAVAGLPVAGVVCPVVLEDKCRGCGSCEVVCPAAKLAIVVRGRPQRVLKPVEVIRDEGLVSPEG
jgi:Fe-S-cluster-containing hydrogenase component 2